MKFKTISILLIVVFFTACNNNQSEKKITESGSDIINNDSLSEIKRDDTLHKKLLDTSNVMFQDSDFVDVTLFSDKFVVSMRYATKDNFVDTVLYPCSECLLRFEVVKDLLKAETEFEKDGNHIKLYDCYRPYWVQKLMWEKVSEPGLVADPKTGSRHNRGSAVDISLVDASGKELDFGTEHDDFTKKAMTFYANLPDTVKQNRLYLRKVMKNNHFSGINSEWWHFSHDCGTKYKISNRGFDCDTVN